MLREKRQSELGGQMNRKAVGVLAAAVLMLGLVPGLAHAGTLDQQQTSNSSGAYNIFSGSANAQTFTAGITGALDQVDLHLFQNGAVNAQLSVQIRDAPGGLVGDTVLASSGIGPGIGASPGAFMPIVFTAPAPIVAGVRYAIVVYTTTGGGSSYSWGHSNSGPYASGQAFQGGGTHPPTGGSFSVIAGTDFAFRTYVKPPAPAPAAAATGLRRAALKKCKKKRSKKARQRCRKRALKLPV